MSKRWMYILIAFLILFETSLSYTYPYNAIILSFIGYLVYTQGLSAILYSLGISLLLGINLENLIFFLVYPLVLNTVYRHIVFKRINLIIITLLQASMYITHIYIFKIRDILIINWVQEFLFILLYNFILCVYMEYDQLDSRG